MPCLDGNALTTDAEGLAFLAAVLETPAEAKSAPDAFTPGGVRHPWTIIAAEPPLAATVNPRLTETV